MNAREIFPDDAYRNWVRSCLDLFDGILMEVIDPDGKVLFQSKLCA